MSRSLVVTVGIVTEQEEVMLRAMETFGRMAAGLALEGIHVNISVASVEDDET